MSGAVRRCVLSLGRANAAASRRIRRPVVRSVFSLAEERIARAVTTLGDTDLVLAGGDERPVLAPHARMLKLRGRSFGEKIISAFEDVRALGYLEVVAIIDDAPAIDRDVLRRAFHALEKLGIVVGPSPDGGVYLIGARRPVDHLFAGVRWKTQFVCADLLARARDAALLERRGAIDG